jgi:hypothetical protein
LNKPDTATLIFQQQIVIFIGPGVPADTLFASRAVLLVTPWLSIGRDSPAYTLGCEADGVATSSKGASLSVAARGVL